MAYKNHIQRLRETVQKAVARGAVGQNFIKQLTIDEAMCLLSDYDLLLGEVQAMREHFESQRKAMACHVADTNSSIPS